MNLYASSYLIGKISHYSLSSMVIVRFKIELKRFKKNVGNEYLIYIIKYSTMNLKARVVLNFNYYLHKISKL